MMQDPSQHGGQHDMIVDHHHGIEEEKVHLDHGDADHHNMPSQEFQCPVDLSMLDNNSRNMVIELHRQWCLDFQFSREKLLVDMTEKLHQEFLSDQQKIRTDLLTQFKEELDGTRLELESKYRETLKTEVAKVQEKHKREIQSAKKKQWCWQCENEAIYHCCWNTAYCSVECQQSHWHLHRKFCRRKKQQQSQPNGGSNPGSANTSSNAPNTSGSNQRPV
ncbi:unnamed protein product [Auanema sp. JU1783]|nr:unnamed protein product [Auanema sp. JU1783]